MKSLKKWLLPVLFLLILLVIVLLWTGWNHYLSLLYYVERGEESVSSTAVMLESGSANAPGQQALSAPDTELQQERGVMNIMLIGVDNDYLGGINDLGNADGLVLLSVNSNTRQLVMTSFMRDLYVSVPGFPNTKLTISYHWGGTSTLLDTLESNFGLVIDNYVLVNYISVVDIVDALGGLDLELSAEEIYYMQDKINNVCYLVGRDAAENALRESQAGLVHLNGVQTAAYLRVRNAGNNDFERTERARRVLSLILEKARGLSILEMNDFAETLLPCVTTDLTEGAILELLLKMPKILKYELVSSRIPIDDSYYFANYYGSVVVPDYEVNRDYLYRLIYEGNAD